MLEFTRYLRQYERRSEWAHSTMWVKSRDRERERETKRTRKKGKKMYSEQDTDPVTETRRQYQQRTNHMNNFFCETFFLLADNKKRITDIDTTIIRTIIILPTHRVNIHTIPGSVTLSTSAIYDTKIYVNTPTCTKQPYYTYNLCCLFPKHLVFLYSK